MKSACSLGTQLRYSQHAPWPPSSGTASMLLGHPAQIQPEADVERVQLVLSVPSGGSTPASLQQPEHIFWWVLGMVAKPQYVYMRKLKELSFFVKNHGVPIKNVPVSRQTFKCLRFQLSELQKLLGSSGHVRHAGR